MSRRAHGNAGSRRRAAAFTFVELLAVIALASLVGLMGLSAIGGTSDVAAVEAAAGAFRDADRRARLHAQNTGQASLGWTEGALRVR